MSELRAIDVPALVARAEEALSKACGDVVKLGALHPLGNPDRRNFIAIAHCGDGGTRSVVLKATRSPTYDPAAESLLQISGLAREWVATAYIAARTPGRKHGCALLAGDVSSGVLVFEDLGADVSSLVDPLLNGTADGAERTLTLYATALARLHGDAVDCFDAHRETFQSIFGAGRPVGRRGWRVESDAEIVTKLIGGAPPASELELLSSRLSDPGPWSSLIHGDPFPDNALVVDGRVRLIDYEFARPSHALLDGIYWKIGFPTCWCAGRVPTDVEFRIDARYRDELGNSIPLARNDTAYRTELAYMAAVWLFTCLSWRLDEALKSDVRWGTWSIRGRLLWYLEAVVEMTSAATATSWLSELKARWPDARPLGLYPAFGGPA
jgi:hypothetical protein